MTKIIPLTEAKARLTRLVAGVEDRGDEVIVTRNGRPAAMLVNLEDYEGLQETLAILARPHLRRQIVRSRRFFDRGGKGLTIEEVSGGDIPAHDPVPPDVAAMVAGLAPVPKRRLKTALESLGEDADSGKELQKELVGLRSIRANRWRIVYRLVGRMVEIHAIGLREGVYEEAVARLRDAGKKP